MKFELEAFNRNVPDEELLADLVAANAVLRSQGKKLTFRSYYGIGKFSPTTVNDRFGTWNSALRAAGLVPAEERNVPLDSLLDNIRIVWIAKGRQPVFRDMNAPPSTYSGSTYDARFGGWRSALKTFVATFDQDEQQLITYEIENETPKVLRRTKREPSLGLRFFVLKRDSFRCVSCGRSPATTAGLVLEVDHVFAWSKGGETVAENLQSLCFDCNRGKGAT